MALGDHPQTIELRAPKKLIKICGCCGQECGYETYGRIENMDPHMPKVLWRLYNIFLEKEKVIAEYVVVHGHHKE